MRGALALGVSIVLLCALGACGSNDADPPSAVGSWSKTDPLDGTARYWDIKSDGTCKRIVVEPGAAGKTSCEPGTCVIENGKVTRSVPLNGTTMTQHTALDFPSKDILRFLPDIDGTIRLYDRGDIPANVKCP